MAWHWLLPEETQRKQQPLLMELLKSRHVFPWRMTCDLFAMTGQSIVLEENFKSCRLVLVAREIGRGRLVLLMLMLEACPHQRGSAFHLKHFQLSTTHPPDVDSPEN